ncbi:MAG: hypothetical protein NTW74_12190 [Acidobacteria bacterium]|nr:hypothetical protein [Acidobacteriota bacterium]
MNRNKWILTGKFAAVLSVPFVLWAYNSGAPQRSTGAPGDQTCLQSGCHVGTRTNDSPNLEILWEGGANYQPGVRQKFTVRITDTARRYGFQASARLESSTINGAAGSFRPLSTATYVICDNGQDRPATGCPASAPVEFITHSAPSISNTFEFEWTPPASQAAGAVMIYVAANASNGPAPSGAKVHLKSIRLQPGAGGGGARPTISQGGVVQASAFGGGSTISAGSWIEIFGQDLGNLPPNEAFAVWDNSFNNGVAPTNLANTRVTVDGKAAFIAFVNKGQVNVQVPDGIATGSPVEVKVITSGGESAPLVVTSRPRSPGILAPPAFRSASARQFVVAEFPDSTANVRVFAGLPGSVAGVNMRLPKPGDRLVIYGVGFGATSPAIAAGTAPAIASRIPGVQVLLGNAPVTTEYAGLAPSAVGLYQFNIIVPNVQAGDNEIVFTVDGVRTQSNVFLTTGN